MISLDVHSNTGATGQETGSGSDRLVSIADNNADTDNAQSDGAASFATPCAASLDDD